MLALIAQLNQQYSCRLVSESPRRRELLQELGLNFKVKKNPHRPTEEQVRDFFYRRDIVTATTDKLKGLKPAAGELLIACDTIVVYNGRVLGKPQNKVQARDFLNKLSGHKHQVVSCLIIRQIQQGKISDYRALEKTVVYFRHLPPAEIESYLATAEPYDKAGGYGIQGSAKSFVKKINGCYFNVVGLPVAKLIGVLEKINSNKGARQ